MFAVAVSLITGKILYISDQAASILRCKRGYFKNAKFVEFLAPQDVSVFYTSTTPYRLPSWNICNRAGEWLSSRYSPALLAVTQMQILALIVNVLPSFPITSWGCSTGALLEHLWTALGVQIYSINQQDLSLGWKSSQCHYLSVLILLSAKWWMKTK